jgi:preprotein translocase subunit SecA/nephrocystin-3
LGESLRERFSQVDRYVERHLSVTEMEMQFGVLERPEELHAYFFIKEQETDDTDEPEKLAALKAAVRSNGRYPVSTYSSPEDLANQVEAAFTKLLDELYPEGALSELEKERIGQRAYLNSLCQNYIRTDANFEAIDGWMRDWERHQLVITGASGLGKSALVANWVKEKLAVGEELPYRIIYHFVGNGGSVGSYGHIIKVLCDEIKDKYGFISEENENDQQPDKKAFDDLFDRLADEGDKPLVVVLDAINQIIDTDHSKRLNWLPIPPKNVKILFTTLMDDETMEVFSDRQYPVYMLQPLTREQRKEMVRGYLSIFSKKLQPHQVERIVDDPQCENTLVLKSLLDELVNFGIFEKLDERIDNYLNAESIDDFYETLLKSYENDHSEPLVKHILSLISVSRNGLSEDELLAITKETPLRWSQFFCSFRQHLVVKNGLITFAHSYIRKAAEDRYVAGHNEWERSCREEIISILKDNKSHRSMDEVPYQYDMTNDLERLHDYLKDLDVFSYLQRTDVNNLGKYWHKLIEERNCSMDEYMPLVEILPENKRMTTLSRLSAFSRLTVVDPNLSLKFIELALPYATNDKKKGYILNRIGLSYGQLGDNKKALVFVRKALDIRRSLMGQQHSFSDVAQSYNNVGHFYGQLGDHNKALEYELKALNMGSRLYLGNHPDLALYYNNVGLTYGSLGNNKKALEYEEKALDIRLSLFGETHPDVATSYNNVGLTYGSLGNHKKALEYKEKALSIRLSLFGENHPDVAISYNNVGATLGKFGEYKKELEYEEKALKIWLSLFGENHPHVAKAFNNVGATYGKLGDRQKEIELRKKALNIAIRIGDANSAATLYNRVGRAYKSAGQQEIANDYFRTAAEKFRELGNEAQAEANLKEINE